MLFSVSKPAFAAAVLLYCCLVSSALAATSANALLKAAQQLRNGRYYIQNVATGQRLTGNRNNLYPAYGTGTAVTVVRHDSGSRGKYTVIGLGDTGARKCLSAAWAEKGNPDATGAMYSCALGILATGNAKSNIQQEKQAFILVPAGEKYKRGISTEASAGLDQQSIFADEDYEDGTSQRMVKRARPTSYGPFYLIATDHIQDQGPRALVNQAVISLGQRVMKLVPWRKGNKNQLWEFIPAR